MLRSLSKLQRLSLGFKGLSSSNIAMNDIAFRQFFAFCSNASPDANEPNIWKRLNIEAMEKEIEVIYDKDNITGIKCTKEEQIQAKTRLNQKLGQFIIFLKQNSSYLNAHLNQINLTTDIVSKEISHLVQSINNLQLTEDNRATVSNMLKYFYEYICSREKSDQFEMLAVIMEIEVKLKNLLLVFMKFDHKSSIINSHPSLFQKVWQKIKIIKCDNPQLIKTHYKHLQLLFHKLAGVVAETSRFQDIKILQRLMVGVYLPMHIFSSQRNLMMSLHFFRNMQLGQGVRLLDMSNDGFIGTIVEIAWPRIQTNRMIYIPADGDFNQKLDIFKEGKNSIPVRVLYHDNLPMIGQKKKTKEKDQENQNEKEKEKEKESEKQQAEWIQQVFIHIHGGGFVAQSSYLTQNHTRVWANQTKMPIFSIEYRMPPNYPYPQAPLDCLQVYRFITQQLHKYMRIRPKTTYIGGDSAGGSLTCSLTALILKNGLLAPKNLFLIYPSTDIRKVYYPSRRYLIDDPALWPPMVNVMMESYITKPEHWDEHLANPISLTEQYVGGSKGDGRFPLKWPKTVMMVGIKDSLRDQGLLLMQRMVQSNIDCQCLLFENYKHAFLSYQQIVKQCQKAIILSTEIVKKLQLAK